jgi:hypothetical protein
MVCERWASEGLSPRARSLETSQTISAEVQYKEANLVDSSCKAESISSMSGSFADAAAGESARDLPFFFRFLLALDLGCESIRCERSNAHTGNKWTAPLACPRLGPTLRPLPAAPAPFPPLPRPAETHTQ